MHHTSTSCGMRLINVPPVPVFLGLTFGKAIFRFCVQLFKHRGQKGDRMLTCRTHDVPVPRVTFFANSQHETLSNHIEKNKYLPVKAHTFSPQAPDISPNRFSSHSVYLRSCQIVCVGLLLQRILERHSWEGEPL